MSTSAIALVILLAPIGPMPLEQLLALTKPKYDELNPSTLNKYEVYRSARERLDIKLARDTISQLAYDATQSRELRSYFLLRRAQLESALSEHQAAIETLHEIVNLRADNPEIQYLAELQAAYVMSQAGTPGGSFYPSIQEQEQQFSRVFSYEQFRLRVETFEAHLEFAGECVYAVGRDSRLGSYTEIGRKHIGEAEAILQSMRSLDASITGVTSEEVRAFNAELVAEKAWLERWEEGVKRERALQSDINSVDPTPSGRDHDSREDANPLQALIFPLFYFSAAFIAAVVVVWVRRKHKRKS